MEASSTDDQTPHGRARTAARTPVTAGSAARDEAERADCHVYVTCHSGKYVSRYRELVQKRRQRWAAPASEEVGSIRADVAARKAACMPANEVIDRLRRYAFSQKRSCAAATAAAAATATSPATAAAVPAPAASNTPGTPVLCCCAGGAGDGVSGAASSDHGRCACHVTPLTLAAVRGDVEEVQLLIRQGRDPREVCRLGHRRFTALVVTPSWEVAQLLLQRAEELEKSIPCSQLTTGDGSADGSAPPEPTHVPPSQLLCQKGSAGLTVAMIRRLMAEDEAWARKNSPYASGSSMENGSSSGSTCSQTTSSAHEPRSTAGSTVSQPRAAAPQQQQQQQQEWDPQPLWARGWLLHAADPRLVALWAEGLEPKSEAACNLLAQLVRQAAVVLLSMGTNGDIARWALWRVPQPGEASAAEGSVAQIGQDVRSGQPQQPQQQQDPAPLRTALQTCVMAGMRHLVSSSVAAGEVVDLLAGKELAEDLGGVDNLRAWQACVQKAVWGSSGQLRQALWETHVGKAYGDQPQGALWAKCASEAYGFHPSLWLLDSVGVAPGALVCKATGGASGGAAAGSTAAGSTAAGGVGLDALAAATHLAACASPGGHLVSAGVEELVARLQSGAGLRQQRRPAPGSRSSSSANTTTTGAGTNDTGVRELHALLDRLTHVNPEQAARLVTRPGLGWRLRPTATSAASSSSSALPATDGGSGKGGCLSLTLQPPDTSRPAWQRESHTGVNRTHVVPVRPGETTCHEADPLQVLEKAVDGTAGSKAVNVRLALQVQLDGPCGMLRAARNAVSKRLSFWLVPCHFLLLFGAAAMAALGRVRQAPLLWTLGSADPATSDAQKFQTRAAARNLEAANIAVVAAAFQGGLAAPYVLATCVVLWLLGVAELLVCHASAAVVKRLRRVEGRGQRHGYSARAQVLLFPGLTHGSVLPAVVRLFEGLLDSGASETTWSDPVIVALVLYIWRTYTRHTVLLMVLLRMTFTATFIVYALSIGRFGGCTSNSCRCDWAPGHGQLALMSVLAVFCVEYAVVEVRQAVRNVRYWARQPWNWFDVVQIMLLLNVLVSHWTCGASLSTLRGRSQVLVLCLGWRVMHFTTIIPQLGIFVRMVHLIIKRLRVFFFVLGFLTCIFAAIFAIVDWPLPADTQSEGGRSAAAHANLVFARLFAMMFGADFGVETLMNTGIESRGVRDVTAWMIVAFMVLVVLILMNLLISIIGEAYSKAREQQHAIGIECKAALIVEVHSFMTPWIQAQFNRIMGCEMLLVLQDPNGPV